MHKFTVHVYICLKCNIIGTDLRIVKQSPGVVERTSFTAPCALYCVAHPHTVDILYEWHVIPEDVLAPVLASTPVNNTGGYICTVTVDGESIESDIILVHFVPCECFCYFICSCLKWCISRYLSQQSSSDHESSHGSVGSSIRRGVKYDQDLSSSGIARCVYTCMFSYKFMKFVVIIIYNLKIKCMYNIGL